MVEQSPRKTQRQTRTILWNNQENESTATPHPVEKNRVEFKILAQNKKKEDWEKFASSLNCNTPLNQIWNRVGQLKGKNPKKLPSLKSMEHSTRTSKA